MSIRIFGMDLCPLELITGDNGKLSTTKIWQNVANVAMTYKIVTYNPDTITWEYVAWNTLYLAIVGGSYIAAKFLDMKFTGAPQDVVVNQPAIMNVTGDVKNNKKKARK